MLFVSVFFGGVLCIYHNYSYIHNISQYHIVHYWNWLCSTNVQKNAFMAFQRMKHWAWPQRVDTLPLSLKIGQDDQPPNMQLTWQFWHKKWIHLIPFDPICRFTVLNCVLVCYVCTYYIYIHIIELYWTDCNCNVWWLFLLNIVNMFMIIITLYCTSAVIRASIILSLCYTVHTHTKSLSITIKWKQHIYFSWGTQSITGFYNP